MNSYLFLGFVLAFAAVFFSSVFRPAKRWHTRRVKIDRLIEPDDLTDFPERDSKVPVIPTSLASGSSETGRGV